MSMKDFQVLQKLGSGSFSDVYKVKRLSDQEDYAMKKVKLAKLSAKEKENALNEIRILASVNHKNVIGYKEAFFDEQTNELCIVMEIANGGDLDAKITQAKGLKSFVKEDKIWHIFKQMVEGLVALHNAKIVHRDIKCANIFLSKEGGVKLGDMNVSKIAKAGVMQTQTGTPYYCPPEVWKDKPYNEKCDIWSLGCVIYELTSLKPPFLAKNMQELYSKVTCGKYPVIPKHFSQDLSKIIGMCLQTNPMLRPSAKELIAMPALAGKEDKTKQAKNHFRANSQAKEQMNSKIELLKTIHMPKNMKKLKDVLPPTNYEIETPVVETMYSEKPQLKKGSKMEYDYTKLNYESDAAALNSGNVQKSPKKDARQQRAARFRDRSAQNPDVRRNELTTPSMDHDEPRKCQDSRLPNINSALGQNSKPSNHLSSRPNLPPTPPKSQRPRYKKLPDELAPMQLNVPSTIEPRRNLDHHPKFIQRGHSHLSENTRETHESQDFRQPKLKREIKSNIQIPLDHNQNPVEFARQYQRQRKHERANSEIKYERKHGEPYIVPYEQIRNQIAQNSPARIRDQASKENQVIQAQQLGQRKGLKIDSQYPSNNQINNDSGSVRNFNVNNNGPRSQRNNSQNNQYDFNNQYNSANPSPAKDQYNSQLRNQQPRGSELIPNFQNNLERAQAIMQKDYVSARPPMSSRIPQRNQAQSGLQLRPPSGKAPQMQPMQLQAPGSNPSLPQLNNNISPRYGRGVSRDSGQRQNIANMTPNITSSSKKPTWWG